MSIETELGFDFFPIKKLETKEPVVVAPVSKESEDDILYRTHPQRERLDKLLAERKRRETTEKFLLRPKFARGGPISKAAYGFFFVFITGLIATHMYTWHELSTILTNGFTWSIAIINSILHIWAGIGFEDDDRKNYPKREYCAYGTNWVRTISYLANEKKPKTEIVDVSPEKIERLHHIPAHSLKSYELDLMINRVKENLGATEEESRMFADAWETALKKERAIDHL